MKKILIAILQACRKCWLITVIMVLLFVGNAIHIVLGCQEHHVTMPLFLKILDTFDMARK